MLPPPITIAISTPRSRTCRICFAISVTITGEIASWLPGSRSASPLNLSTIRRYFGGPPADSRLDMKNSLGLRRDTPGSQGRACNLRPRLHADTPLRQHVSAVTFPPARHYADPPSRRHVSPLAYHFPELSLIHNLDPQLACFVQLASCIFTGQQVVGLFAHAGGDPPAI